MDKYGELLENVDLKKYTTLGIGGVCKYLIYPSDINSLKELINYLNSNGIKYFILGNGSNVILDDAFFDGVIIKLDKLNHMEISNNIFSVDAGVRMSKAVSYLLDNGYISLSPLASIPGTIGGSIVGNAGCYNDEIMNYLIDVTVIDKDGNIKVIKKNDISFGYRYTSLKDKYIIVSANFLVEKGNVKETKKEMLERNEKRILSQPLDKKSVGSIFRNPDGYSSGKLIDDLGLKNYSIGGAKVSDKHANFIVNEDNATFYDMIDLINKIKKDVKDKYNIDLVLEPSIIKWNEL